MKQFKKGERVEIKSSNDFAEILKDDGKVWVSLKLDNGLKVTVIRFDIKRVRKNNSTLTKLRKKNMHV